MTDARLTKAWPSAGVIGPVAARLGKDFLTNAVTGPIAARATKTWLTVVISRRPNEEAFPGSYIITGYPAELAFEPAAGTTTVEDVPAIRMRIFPIVRDDEVREVHTRVKMNRAIAGKLNVNGQVTLLPNAATTTLSDLLIDSTSMVKLIPTTENAAGAVTTTYFNAPIEGSVVINHANNSMSDKIFKYSVIG